MVAVLGGLLTVAVTFVLTHRGLKPQLLLHFFVLLVPNHPKDEGSNLTKYWEVVSEDEKNTVVNRDAVVPKVAPFGRQFEKIENTSEQKRQSKQQRGGP
jgi:hypothetical protein